MSNASDDDIGHGGGGEGFSDDDFGLGSDAEGGMLLTELLDRKTRKDKPSDNEPAVAKSEVTARAKLLRGTAQPVDGSDVLEPLLESDDDRSDESGDEDALQSVVRAATGRDVQSRQARAEAVEVTQGVGPEDAFAAPVKRARSAGQTLNDMMAVLNDGEGQNLGALKKRVARIERGPLAAPLSDVATGRIERAAAYKQAVQQMTDRWAPTVKANRRAQKLKFPLGAPNRSERSSTVQAVETFEPKSEGLEAEIDALLKEGGVASEKDAANAENQAMGNVSREEVVARRRELARMRSLMFEYERKMRRMSRIKSKKFRRIMKNERMKLDAELKGDEHDDVAERLDAERKRAEERVSLRHKNTSKWVKRQLSRGETKRNPDAKAAIEDQLRMHEQLKRRQQQVVDLSGSEDGDSDAPGSDMEDMNVELRDMKKSLVESAQKPQPKFKSGLMNMKFMQVAAERERKEALEMLNEMQSDEEGENEYGSDSERKSIAKDRKGGVEMVGRRVFSGSSALNDNREHVDEPASEKAAAYGGIDDEAAEAEEEEQLIRAQYEADASLLEDGGHARKPNIDNAEEILCENNDLSTGFITKLQGRISAGSRIRPSSLKVLTPKNDKGQGTKEISIDVVNSLPKKGAQKSNKELETASQGEEVIGNVHKRKQVEIADVDRSSTGKTKLSKRARRKKKVQFTDQVSTASEEIVEAKHNELTASAIGDNSGVVNESAESEKADETQKSSKQEKSNGKTNADAKKKALEADRARMQLVARAFAGLGGADEAEFEASKNAAIEKEIDKETKGDAIKLLPGWGSWDGAGVRKKAKRSAFAEAAKAKLAEARSRAIAARADRDHGMLQLSANRSKAARELTVGSVPFPFRSKEEWERECSVPIVGELLARKTFENNITEKIETRRGVAINPITGGAIVDNEGIAKRSQSKSMKRHCAKGGKANGKGIKKPFARGKRGIIERRQKTSKERESKRRALLT